MIETEKDNRKLVERAVLIGIQDASTLPEEAIEHLEELGELVDTMGIPVIKKAMVKLKQAHPKYLIGSGKASEILDMLAELKADCVVFDYELTPSQQRNWEKLTKLCVIDRQEVILDIFASRALTKEAALQVELARMQYSLPRLTRAWTHLSRQRGGAKGTRGEGEQQIEADRRIVKQRIAHLQKELKEVRKQRDSQRKKRDRSPLPHGAIVGYTNAGKSSLLNALANSDVLVEDKLFATLDPTTRRVKVTENSEMLLTDTVGFVRKLPHNLVEAFKSTLEEAALADFLVITLDISDRYVEDHWQTTLSVLKELGADEKKSIAVFNKTDLNNDPVLAARLKALHPDYVFVSTKTGAGLDELRSRLDKKMKGETETIKLKIPPTRHDIISLAHEKGKVLNSKYEENGELWMTLNINKSLKSKFNEFSI
jgi:GTP-binding protein HflX